MQKVKQQILINPHKEFHGWRSFSDSETSAFFAGIYSLAFMRSPLTKFQTPIEKQGLEVECWLHALV